MPHVLTVKLLSSNRNGFIQYISNSFAKIVQHCLIWETDGSTVTWSKIKIYPISRNIYNAECPLMKSAEVAQVHASWKSKRLIHESLPQENEKFMSTMSQCSRTVSLLFEDRSFSCSLDLIDLVKKSNGSKRDEHWSLTFWLNRVRCFIFRRYDPSIISLKSVTCKTEMQSLSSFWQFWLRSYKSHPLENEKFRKTMSQLSCKNRLPFEERNLLRLYCDRSCDVNQTFQRVNS